MTILVQFYFHCFTVCAAVISVAPRKALTLQTHGDADSFEARSVVDEAGCGEILSRNTQGLVDGYLIRAIASARPVQYLADLTSDVSRHPHRVGCERVSKLSRLGHGGGTKVHEEPRRKHEGVVHLSGFEAARADEIHMRARPYPG